MAHIGGRYVEPRKFYQVRITWEPEDGFIDDPLTAHTECVRYMNAVDLAILHLKNPGKVFHFKEIEIIE